LTYCSSCAKRRGTFNFVHYFKGISYAQKEWGVKRICPTTGKRFYDLNRDPIVSPYTGEEVKLDDTKSRLIQADGEDLSARKATESDAVEEDVVLDDDDMDVELDDDLLEEDEDDNVSLDDIADVSADEDES
tara:strand:+ start:767 stop:1162 length:396 start_codon:yes stop_codon:yes gene_type:complete